MKKRIFTMVIGLMLSACTNSQDTIQVISVLEDVTENNFLARPDALMIHKSFALYTDPWKGASFRYGMVSSLIHNKRLALHLEPANALLGNELERRNAVNIFQTQIRQVLEVPKDPVGHRYSSIWKPLVAELKSLQDLPNTNGTLYLFSDLQENSKWFSVHKYTDLQQLNNNIEDVKALFLQQSEGLVASKNISVVVVYQPRNLKEDEVFSQMQQLYQSIFDDLGIPILFKAHHQ